MDVHSIDELRQALPDFAKDIRLNLGMIMSEEGSPGLTASQVFGVALTCAYATREQTVISGVEGSAKEAITEQEVHAAKAAATIMAMNNVYYRTLHLMTDKELEKLPAKLRMNVIASPGVDRISFELYSLAVSALNGCGMCVDAHSRQLKEHGVTSQGIQSTVRIAAVINAAAQGCALI